MLPEPVYHVPRPERWLPIPGYEGLYIISDRGRARNINKARGTRVLRFMKPSRGNSGYYIFNLRRDGVTRSFTVHRLVARTFLGEGFPGAFVNHINADKLDNRAVNLEWVTPQENREHAMRLGLYPSGAAHYSALHPGWRAGTRNGRSKLTATTVREARALATAGWKPTRIGRHLGVTSTAIALLLKGKTWSHVI